MTRRRRRMLRGAMWACMACSAATGAVCAWSGWYSTLMQYGSTRGVYFCGTNRGSLMVGWGPGSAIPWKVRGFDFEIEGHPAASWRWWWSFNFATPIRVAQVPLWFLALLPLAPAFLCYRLSRRPIAGQCPSCHYDRRGLAADAPCPECGKVPG